MQHFTIENAVASLNLAWHFLFKDARAKNIENKLDVFDDTGMK
jgi:hypothetical protein